MPCQRRPRVLPRHASCPPPVLHCANPASSCAYVLCHANLLDVHLVSKRLPPAHLLPPPRRDSHLSLLHRFPQVCRLYLFFSLCPVLTTSQTLSRIRVLLTVCLTSSHSQNISLIFHCPIDAFAYHGLMCHTAMHSMIFILKIYYHILLLRSTSLCLSPMPHHTLASNGPYPTD